MHVLHQQITVTYHRLALGSGASADSYIFADRIVVTYLTGGDLTLKLQILGLCGNGSSGEELVVIADAGAKVNGNVIEELVIVANDNVLVNHTKGTDHVAISQLSLGIDYG